MKTIKDLDIKNKRVLVRCDFNVPLDERGRIEDDFRIKQALPTLQYLIKNKAKLILMSHLAGGKSLDVVWQRLKEYLKTKAEGITFLENLRINKGEEENNDNFAKELAKLADVYVNDAFSVCHRNHASIVGVPKFLLSGAGLLLEKEVKILSRVLENPWRPLVVVIGGVKIESKIKAIKNLLDKADHLLIGGKIAELILIVKGICVGRPWPEEKAVKEIEKLDLASTKLHLPIDSLISPDETGKVYIRESGPAKVRKDEKLLDIGPETIQMFSKIIKDAKMIVWAGPLGYFEVPKFEKGTKEIGEKIARNHRAFKIAGGGDTIFALSKFGLRDKFDHISTGGGAMLEFLSGKILPGLEALKWKSKI